MSRPNTSGSRFDDRGVSAVIGVILMVAITVAIAATVYIWVGGFDTGGSSPESASATAKVENFDGNDRAEWIKITLASGGDNAPYSNSTVNVEIVAGGSVFNAVCDAPSNGPDEGVCDDYFGANSTGAEDPSETWKVGSSKYFPCQNGNDHSVTFSVRGQVVLDRSVNCEEPA